MTSKSLNTCGYNLDSGQLIYNVVSVVDISIQFQQHHLDEEMNFSAYIRNVTLYVLLL